MPHKKLFLFFLSSIFISVNFFCSTSKKQETQKLTSYASLNDTVKYVGKETCRKCHADIYQTFMHTGMGSSFDIASAKKTSAKFDNHALVYDKFKDFFYKPFFEGDSLRIMEFRLEKKDTVYKRIETINFIVGSGQHTNSHMINTNGYFTQAPATFYTQKGQWDLPPGFEDGHNTRFSRIIGLECMTCHNGYPDFVLGSENKFNSVKRGIDCERCHGPGEAHAQQKMQGILIDTTTEIDYSIVNPAKLPVQLQFDICQRCHIQGNAILNDGKSFLDFKPAMHLSEVMNVFMPVYKGREDEHIMASHAERLKMSRCYLETSRQAEKKNLNTNVLKPYKDALTCVTCHNPHVSVRVTSDETFNSVCTKCHSPEKNNLCTENKIALTKNENNCVKCHMQLSSATDIPHVRVHDHYIHVPLKEKKIESIKQFVGIACINNPAPPKKAIADAYIGYFEKFGFDKSFLDSALKILNAVTISAADFKNNFNSLVQVYFLKNDYQSVVKASEKLSSPFSALSKKSYSNSDAWTCYRIAESYQNLNALDKALPFYKQATVLAPFQLDFLQKYATALSLTGNYRDAKTIYEFIISENPKYVAALCNLGFLFLTQEKNSAKAEELYDKALELNPDYEQALLNKAGLYIYLQKTGEAKTILKNLLKKNPYNTQAKQILEQLISQPRAGFTSFKI